MKSAIGESTLDLPLPLYAPARVHVLTDRPLYEPGNTVKFRAVALKGSDLTPLDGRPGLWRVYDAQNTLLLEERSPAGAWGVTSGTFPLDQGAESGGWRVEWHSGGAVGTRAFSVRPFTLPRFRIEAAPVKAFYRRGERPVVFFRLGLEQADERLGLLAGELAVRLPLGQPQRAPGVAEVGVARRLDQRFQVLHLPSTRRWAGCLPECHVHDPDTCRSAVGE